MVMTWQNRARNVSVRALGWVVPGTVCALAVAYVAASSRIVYYHVPLSATWAVPVHIAINVAWWVMAATVVLGIGGGGLAGSRRWSPRSVWARTIVGAVSLVYLVDQVWLAANPPVPGAPMLLLLLHSAHGVLAAVAIYVLFRFSIWPARQAIVPYFDSDKFPWAGRFRATSAYYSGRTGTVTGCAWLELVGETLHRPIVCLMLEVEFDDEPGVRHHISHELLERIDPESAS